MPKRVPLGKPLAVMPEFAPAGPEAEAREQATSVVRIVNPDGTVDRLSPAGLLAAEPEVSAP